MTLAALVSQSANVSPRKSLFIKAKVNGKDVRIMVDTRATHSFVTVKKAMELGQSYVSSDTMLKTINALPAIVHGFNPKVPIDLGGWTGFTDFAISPMDVFNIILGLDFCKEVNAFI